MPSTHEPVISVTMVPPLGSGVSPFGDDTSRGGSCPQAPVVPIWRTIFFACEMNRTRQLPTSATVTVPSGSMYASSGVCSRPGELPLTLAVP